MVCQPRPSSLHLFPQKQRSFAEERESERERDPLKQPEMADNKGIMRRKGERTDEQQEQKLMMKAMQ